jgi:hypothetical protein
MKTFKTRSGAMKRDNAIRIDTGSCIVSISTPPNYILFLDEINYACQEDANGICLGTASVAYFSYDSGQMQNIYILFSKSSFTSNDLDKIGNIISIFILGKLYTVKYKGIISNIYIKYTINEPKDTVLENLDRIRETNKQVVVEKNNTTQGDRGFYQIFTDKGKVRILG